MICMYGIPNCDSIKKAKEHLKKRNVDFQFRDVRKEPLSDTEWKSLLKQDKDNLLVNAKSPNFRKNGFQ